MPRSAQQIIDQTNKLAREFYRLLGYKVPKGHRFDLERENRHPQEVLCRNMACAAQYELTATDVEDAQSEIEE